MPNNWPTALETPPEIEAYFQLPDRETALTFLLTLKPERYPYWSAWGLDPVVLIQLMSCRTGYDQ